MSRSVVVLRLARAPRGVRLGPWRLWALRMPSGPRLGIGRIAATDTPGTPAPGQTHALDGFGGTVVLGRFAVAVLRCTSVPVRGG
ncbi:hypothetical protein ACWGMP_31355 [Streptomyces albidoflavus]